VVLAGWVAKPRGNARKPTNFKPKTKALDVIWWRIDENTHQSVINLLQNKMPKMRWLLEMKIVKTQLKHRAIKW